MSIYWENTTSGNMVLQYFKQAWHWANWAGKADKTIGNILESLEATFEFNKVSGTDFVLVNMNSNAI